MIIREYAACTVCETPHVLRIGIGHEPVEAHQFACTGCGLEMGVRLEEGVGITFGPNAKQIPWDDSGAVVNLHSSFVFSKEELRSARAFPSLHFGSKLIHALEDARERAGLPRDAPELSAHYPQRAPISREWEHLRAAWSLHRNEKRELADKRLAAFIPEAGYQEPPASLEDWAYQFAAGLTQPHFEQHYERLFAQLDIAQGKDDFERFVAHYGKLMSNSHARRYFEACKAYLNAFTEFSQVHSLIKANIEIGEDHAAASTNFDATRMIYGNLFEAFGDNVELLVALNNLIEDRPFDQLRTIKLAEYQHSDKAARCKAVAGNADFAAVCAEFDNQVRNASHHGSMTFHQASGSVEYRAGKGGKGELRTMGYATYLARTSRLFIQLMLLFRLEILMAHRFGQRVPL